MPGTKDSYRHCPESLEAAVECLRARLASVEAVAETMRLRGINEVDIRCQKALLRAIKDLLSWSHAAEKALAEKLTDPGTFSGTGRVRKSIPPQPSPEAEAPQETEATPQ